LALEHCAISKWLIEKTYCKIVRALAVCLISEYN